MAETYVAAVSMAHAELDRLGVKPSSREGPVPDLADRIRLLSQRTVEKISPQEGYEVLMARDLKERDIVTVILSVTRGLRIDRAADFIDHELEKMRERLILAAFGRRKW